MNSFAAKAELFRSWKAWAETAGEYVGSQKALLQKLARHQFSASFLRDLADVWQDHGRQTMIATGKVNPLSARGLFRPM